MTSISEIKARTLKGIIALTGRGLFLRILSFFSLAFLSSFLSKEEFGVFFLVSAFVNFLVYFSDIGLAAALVQKKEKVTESDLKTTFTIQQILVIGLLLVLFLISPKLTQIYSLSREGIYLLYALGFSFFLSSLKTIPSILMERELEFNRWILPQLIEDAVYNLSVVFFAWNGYGISSFTYAVTLRAVIGLIAIYLIKPWVPGFSFSKDAFKRLLKFGLPYQINTFIAVLKDDGMTIILGGILGTTGVGILGWAQKWAQVPLRLFMDTVTKVSFPAFSRLQNNKVELEKSVTKSILFICFLVFPAVSSLLVLAPMLIKIIPKYDKWEDAIIPLTLVSVNVVFAAATTQITNLLNAIGKIKITFKLMIMWTALSFLLIPILSIKYGVIGAALAYALVGTSSIIAIYIGHKHVPFLIGESIVKPAVSAFIMGTIMYAVSKIVTQNIAGVITVGIFGVMIYALVSYILIGKSIINDVKKALGQVISKR